MWGACGSGHEPPHSQRVKWNVVLAQAKPKPQRGLDVPKVCKAVAVRKRFSRLDHERRPRLPGVGALGHHGDQVNAAKAHSGRWMNCRQLSRRSDSFAILHCGRSSVRNALERRGFNFRIRLRVGASRRDSDAFKAFSNGILNIHTTSRNGAIPPARPRVRLVGILLREEIRL